MVDTPPEDSIFSMPPYKASQFGSSSTNVQMDPAAAMQQSQARFTVARIIRGVSAAVITLLVLAGGSWYMLTKSASSTQASIDLKQAMMGTVSSLSAGQNTFTMTGTTSEDPSILATSITDWTIQLPPGASFTNIGEQAVRTCYTITSFQRNFNEALPVSCVNFLNNGDKAVVEYVIMKPEKATMIAKKIIREE